ncbi:MAG TPA: LuxR C-terminal-related transcriptional regulator, partial [Candidatus Baltobacteraceae bacterium]|nr:LuxR C-terminal-related transcriptional regulator [Candidatus Baltobacteraceae bacterium]
HYIDGSADEPAQFFDLCRSEYERVSDRRGAGRALLMLADQRWVDGRTTEALSSAVEVVDSAGSLGDTELRTAALLSVARFSSTLGMPEEALCRLSDLEGQLDGADAGALSSLKEIRGEALAALGHTKASLAYLCGAAQLAMKTGSPELIAQVENNVALSACDLGELQIAIEHHRHALEEAGRTAMMWRAAYCSLGFARTLMLAGDLRAARTLMWSALETGVTTATFKTKAAAVGIPIALMLNDLAMLETCAREETLELAHRSGEAQRVASVSAAFAELRAEQGSLNEAQALVTRALRVLTCAHRAWDLLVSAARFGTSADVAAARTLLQSAGGRPRVRRAYHLLFEASTCNADPRRSRLAKIAAREFESMGDMLHSAQCLELAGERDAAAAIYRRMGSVRDAQRLQAGTSNGAVDLTPRQTEIARQVALGRTNRQIATQLNISEHTVEHHVSAIFERLGLKSRAQLVRVMARAEAE